MPKTSTQTRVPGNLPVGPQRGDPDFRAISEFLRKWWKEPQA